MNCTLTVIAGAAVALTSAMAAAQDASARTVQYHSQDISAIHAKLKYTTLIEVPTTEKIMEAATGDKDVWIVNVVGNFCFVHPAQAGIRSNLNLIIDKGNIYSFTLQDVSGTSEVPDLKVLIVPADQSSIVASSGPAQYVPAAQLEQSKRQLAVRQSYVQQAVDEYKSAYRHSSNSIMCTRRTNRPSIFNPSITTTSSRTSRPMRRRSSLFARCGTASRTLSTTTSADGTYIIPKIIDSGYVQLGNSA